MKNKAIKIYAFNMIEVALAMAIIAFGMTSILGLFPVGLNASQSAIANNCCSDATEQFTGYLKSHAEVPLLPTQTISNFESIFGTTATTGILREHTPQLAAIRAVGDAQSQAFLAALHLNPANPAVPYDKVPGWQIYKSANPAIYFVIQGTADSTSYDFGAMIIAWKQPIIINATYNGQPQPPYSDSLYSNAAGLCVEISWPLEKQYAEREKRYYYVEVKNPQ